MMKARLLPTSSSSLRASISLVAVLLASCAPVAATETPAQSVPSVVVIVPSATPFPSIDLTATQIFTDDLLSATVPAPTAIPVATSRGPNLEAIDPSTVSLASGQIQFVEFFRFT